MAVNHYERAFRAWPLLVKAAEDHETITYKDLAAHLGIHPRPIRYVLAVIQDYCLAEKKPPITILVVGSCRSPARRGVQCLGHRQLPRGSQTGIRISLGRPPKSVRVRPRWGVRSRAGTATHGFSRSGRRHLFPDSEPWSCAESVPPRAAGCVRARMCLLCTVTPRCIGSRSSHPME